jgi:hypothetical protein
VSGANGDASPPEPIERGRYAAYPQPDGSQGLLLYRASGICDRCRDCGCGKQEEPIDLSMRGLLALRSQFGKFKKGLLPL